MRVSHQVVMENSGDVLSWFFKVLKKSMKKGQF